MKQAKYIMIDFSSKVIYAKLGVAVHGCPNGLRTWSFHVVIL